MFEPFGPMYQLQHYFVWNNHAPCVRWVDSAVCNGIIFIKATSQFWITLARHSSEDLITELPPMLFCCLSTFKANDLHLE